jgi:hypothetical protein
LTDKFMLEEIELKRKVGITHLKDEGVKRESMMDGFLVAILMIGYMIFMIAGLICVILIAINLMRNSFNVAEMSSFGYLSKAFVFSISSGVFSYWTAWKGNAWINGMIVAVLSLILLIAPVFLSKRLQKYALEIMSFNTLLYALVLVFMSAPYDTAAPLYSVSMAIGLMCILAGKKSTKYRYPLFLAGGVIMILFGLGFYAALRTII